MIFQQKNTSGSEKTLCRNSKEILLFNCFCLCGFWRSLGLSGFEFLHSAGGVYDFLVTGEKRMTGAADFHANGFHGRACFYLVSAGAGDNRIGMILGVYFFFHNIIYNTKALILQIICKQTGVCCLFCLSSK